MSDNILEIKSYLNKNNQIIELNNINNYDFSQIDEVKFGVPSFKNFPDGRKIKLISTDFEYPFVIEHGHTLLVNEEYFQKNRDKANQVIIGALQATVKSKIRVLSNFINDEIIDIICNNNNVFVADLGDTLLSSDYYEKFKKVNKKVDTNSVCEELENNFDEIIIFNRTKKILDDNSYDSLINSKKICINKDLTDNELDNLKYVTDNCVIKINSNLDNLFKILNRLADLGKNNLIKFNALDKKSLNELVFNENLNYENLEVQIGYDSFIKIKEFLKYERLLYSMIKSAMNLSPFEKYIYAYNIVKKFKIYRETEVGHSLESRNLYEILDNEYMVCVGFSEFFGNLLEKLGISNTDLSVKVDESYDDVKKDQLDFSESKSVELGGHARRYVYLKDDKYGIDGYFIADPTWDNDLEKDYYNHMIMTNEESVGARRYLQLNYDDIFNVKTHEEYIMKMKRIMNHGYDTKFQEQIKFMLETIRDLDREYYDMLCNKYSYVKDLSSSFDIPDNVSSLVYDLGNYIVGKVNKTVSGETIFDGVREVYKHSYGYMEEEIDNVLEEVRVYNKKRHDIVFPTRYRVNEDGSREVILNKDNKFDFSLDNVKKI